MRTMRALGVTAVGLCCAGLAVVGCFDLGGDCAYLLLCPAGADDGGVDGGTDGSKDGSTDGTPPGCSGDPTTTPAIVSDDCGVFVSAGAASGGTGTKEQPFATFAEAAAAKPARIFACAGAYTETAQVSFSGGVEIYGGFTGCSAAGWTWSAGMQAQITTVQITATADVPGFVLDGGANKLENVSVTAPSAPPTVPGGSSIALLVNGGSFEMTNGALAAGDAQDGAAGTTGAGDPTPDGATGTSGADACLGGTHAGPSGATHTCSDGTISIAGNGGNGGDPQGDPAGGGADGGATPPATAVAMDDGKGGTGEGENAAPLCARGDDGAPGAFGSSGSGATGPGILSATGYAGVAGKDGTDGAPGQGGGGGGGARGITSGMCMGTPVTNLTGASGGAGGTGGCGGALGTGGKAGGSSISLLVLDAQVTLTSVTLTPGKAGNGGAGGSGQSGGHGGTGGPNGNGTGAAQDACPGGKGGLGGVGGPGGGGQGGHSLGIAFQGTTAPAGGTFMITATNAGSGGPGGTNNTTANMGQGASGVAGNCWNFKTNTACQ